MKRNHLQFVVCVKNKGYAASLELRKLYEAVSDRSAAELHQVRVIDESGEDYLYPQEYFVPVHLPESAERALRRTSDGTRLRYRNPRSARVPGKEPDVRKDRGEPVGQS